MPQPPATSGAVSQVTTTPAPSFTVKGCGRPTRTYALKCEDAGTPPSLLTSTTALDRDWPFEMPPDDALGRRARMRLCVFAQMELRMAATAPWHLEGYYDGFVRQDPRKLAGTQPAAVQLSL